MTPERPRDVAVDYPLSRLTTVRTGGHGDYFFRPHSDQALAQVGGGVGLCAGDDDHAVALDLDVVGANVVSEGVEGAARAEVEAGVVPVARHHALLDGAPVQGEAEVGAAVVDGVGGRSVPQHAHRLTAELGQEPSGLLQFLHGAGVDSHAVVLRRSPEFGKVFLRKFLGLGRMSPNGRPPRDPHGPQEAGPYAG